MDVYILGISILLFDKHIEKYILNTSAISFEQSE